MREKVQKMSQAFYPTNDGHIGNVAKLSMPHLLEIIQRQENLLKKKAFLKTLSDKGEKITQHLQVLKEELERRKQKSSRHATESSSDSQKTSGRVQTKGDKNLSDLDIAAVNSIEQRQNRDLENSTDDSVNTNNVANSLEEDFEKMHVKDEIVESASRTKHQYEIAEERAEENLKEKKLYKRLNRSLHIANVEDLPTELRHTDTGKDQQRRPERKLPQEESAAVPPRYRYDEAKVVSLEESLKLQTSQKQKQEDLQTQLASEKLAERLNIKLETYSPEGVDMSYRDRKTAEGYTDSDDEGDDDNETQDVAGMADILESDTED